MILRLLRGVSRYLWLVCLVLLVVLSSTNVVAVESDLKSGVRNQQLINWIKDNISPVTGLPLSFGTRPQTRLDVLNGIGASESVTGIIERIIVEEGMSVYDAAVWQIVLSSLGGAEHLELASRPIETYWRGSLRDLRNIRAGNGSGQRFIYNRKYPDVVSSDLKDKGRRGFIFRIKNAHGNYLSADPLDGKTQFEGFPNWPDIHWEDWKPISGENAWVVIAAMHVYHQKYYDAERGTYTINEDSIELSLARELARAAIFLQAENGGVRMAPIGTYYFSIENIVADNADVVGLILDEAAIESKASYDAHVDEHGVDHALLNSEHTTWYYHEISTENNLSWYTAFSQLYDVTGDETYLKAMARIERYLKTVWNDEEGFFYQGAHFDGTRWIPNRRHFATDVQTWGVSKLTPQRIDQWFGSGSAYRMWQTAKAKSGVFDDEGEVLGVGYTSEEGQLSIEWTVGAIYAMHELANHYAVENPVWAQTAEREARSMREGIESFRRSINEKFAAYSYSSQRRWIPFGWFAHDPEVLSMVSTCWVILYDSGYNPFRLNSRLH